MTNVIFDLGGVLIDWDPALAFADVFASRDAAEAWMAQIGFAQWNREQDRGRSLAQGLAAAEAAHGDAARHLRGYVAAFAVTIEKRIPGSWEIAEALLARNCPLYALTNWSADTWPAALELHPRLGQIFADIVVSGQVGMIKPEPGIYRLLLDRNGLRAGDCLLIDDNAENVAAAQALGMQAIRFTDAATLARDLTRRGLFDL